LGSEYFCVTEDIVEDQGNKKKCGACCGTNIEKLKGKLIIKLLPWTGIYNFAQCVFKQICQASYQWSYTCRPPTDPTGFPS